MTKLVGLAFSWLNVRIQDVRERRNRSKVLKQKGQIRFFFIEPKTGSNKKKVIDV